MKFKNILNLILGISIPIICYVFGFWNATQENNQLKKTILDTVEIQRSNDEIYINQNLDMLVALRKNEYIKVINVVEKMTATYIESTKNNKLKEKALKYQKEFCTTKCLGIQTL